MKPTVRGLGIALFAALVVAAATTGGAQEAKLWLDDENPVAWNEAGAPVPAGPRLGDVDPNCAAQARPAELAEDRLVVDQGWRLDGGYQGGWGIILINATADYDGMCRPIGHQTFVFVDGVFAGTLAPEPMNSRTDGTLFQAFLQQTVDGLEVIAQYARYTANDPLCCSSRTTTVTFAIDRAGPVVRPVSAFTYPNQ